MYVPYVQCIWHMHGIHTYMIKNNMSQQLSHILTIHPHPSIMWT